MTKTDENPLETKASLIGVISAEMSWYSHVSRDYPKEIC
jgi:hypothetical protein